MRKHKKSGAIRFMALVLALVQLLCLTACGKPAAETEPTTVPVETETEGHTHVFADGLCECGESNGCAGIALQTDAALTAVEREDTEEGMILTSANAAGEMQGIRLNKEIDGVYGHYYEVIYKFTSNVAGTVRFISDDAAYYETNEFEVKKGENEIAVRFAAGNEQGGKVKTSLELGGLDKFELTFSEITCEELQENLSTHFLDVAPEKASGRMEKTPEGHLVTTFKTEEGWRVKLAVDRNLVKGRTYETTYVFTRTGGKVQNVTYTVYDGAATILGANTKLVDRNLCVATFYLTANENVKKGTCLEIGLISGGEEASMTFTYVDFKEVEQEKLKKLEKENPFPGVNVWTEASLTPASGTQSSKGLAVSNPNAKTDWWKVKLEKNLDAKKGSYYSVTFKFTSDTAGKVKFVNDGATYYGSNEYTVKKGENTFTVELKSGGSTYSCLELGNLGSSELLFTDISVKKIDKPTKEPYTPNAASQNRFSTFKIWADSTVKKPARSDTKTSMTMTSQNAKTDWWKIKLEKDLSASAGKCYEVTYTFTSDAAGRIKFVNDNATYYGSNEYDVKVGDNTFTVQFKYGGKPYSCLELGDLGPCKLVFQDYSIKEIAEPEVTTNGFENYKGWTESSMKPLVREDTETSMKLISENEAADWWKVKLENNFATEADKTYKATYTFTSTAEGDIKFGGDNMTCHSADVYHVVSGANTFEIIFTVSAANAYNCLELGGLGAFELEFSGITLEETEVPEVPEDHEHSFANGSCTCGETNGFQNFKAWNEGALTAVVREDTANTMKLTSTNEAADWWKVKLENNFATEADKTYKATYTFTSTAEGDIKFGGDNMTCHSADVYHVVSGANTFEIIFTVSAANAYNCLELGGLGAFELEFSGITLEETEVPEVPEDHEHSFVNGSCTCGETNGFQNFKAWNEGALTAVVREDTASTMKLTSTNGGADWWKVKLENNFATEAGKTYKATYVFTSTAEGDIKFGGDNMTCHSADVYHVVPGSNTFEITFTVSAANAYNCLEMGGLGAFELVFSSITLAETASPEVPEVHEHSFVNGSCSCGAKNGFQGFNVWNEGSLTPVVREDTASTMKLISTNGGADWWKVKLENNFATEAGKTYRVTYSFTSTASGDIKFGGDNFTCDGADVYFVNVGANTFTVVFTVSASNTYTCLEMGGLGNFEITFSGISIQEVA